MLVLYMKMLCMPEIPHGILKKIFKLFLKKGGKFIQTNIKSIEQKTIE